MPRPHPQFCASWARSTDQIVESAVSADEVDQRLARHMPGGGEDRRLDPEHPSRQRAAGGRSASSTSRTSSLVRRRRRGAQRPYSRKVGRPDSSRTAPSATSLSNSRRAARSVIGACPAALAGEMQSSASGKSTTFAAGFARSLRAQSPLRRAAPRRARQAARDALPRPTSDRGPEFSSRLAAWAAPSASGGRESGRRSRGRAPPPPGTGRRGRPQTPRRRLGPRRRPGRPDFFASSRKRVAPHPQGRPGVRHG